MPLHSVGNGTEARSLGAFSRVGRPRAEDTRAGLRYKRMPMSTKELPGLERPGETDEPTSDRRPTWSDPRLERDGDGWTGYYVVRCADCGIETLECLRETSWHHDGCPHR